MSPPRLLIAAFYVATAAICQHLSANGDDDSMASLPFREATATNLPSPDASCRRFFANKPIGTPIVSQSKGFYASPEEGPESGTAA